MQNSEIGQHLAKCVILNNVKQNGKWANLYLLFPPPSSAEVKNVWSYISTPPMCLHGVVLN
jgi:hypothetical protein